jgi:hypothetical protein
MIVIGISGKRGAGKSLLSEYLSGFGYESISLASPIKYICRRDFSLTPEQTDGVFKESPTHYKKADGTFWTPREIMIHVGQSYRFVNPDFWIDRLYRSLDTSENYSIPDVRFKNEADRIKGEGGFLVRLERDPKLCIYKGTINDPSECELDDYKEFDLVLPASRNVVPDDLAIFAKEINNHINTSLQNSR